MKKALFILSLLFISVSVHAQENPEWGDVEKNVVTMTEVPPTWPGCSGNKSQKTTCFRSKLNNHIATNFKYPLEAYKKNVEGRVVVEFVINAKGLPEIQKISGGTKILQEEARRNIMLIPQMKPGMLAGKPRAIKYTVPFNFKTGK